MLMFGMRLGADPRTVVTTTPRPAKLIRDLLCDPICVVTRVLELRKSWQPGAGIFRSDHPQIRRHPARPAGARSRAARRHARRAMVARFDRGEPAALSPEMTRIVVAIDPAVTSGEEADETGIVVAGKEKNGHGYVLADISGRYSPTEWARLAITAYRTHRADRIVAEVNNGGDMVGATLRMVGRVEDWRAGCGRSISTLPRFQPPPRRTQHADFPHCAPPFASRRGLLDLSCRGDFRSVASHSIAVEQP